MIFRVIIQDKAIRDFDTHKKAGNKILLKKIQQLLSELEIHPASGTGKPHKLKHKGVEVWSRSIDDRHRLLYTIDKNVVTVFVISLWGHYGDK